MGQGQRKLLANPGRLQVDPQTPDFGVQRILCHGLRRLCRPSWRTGLEPVHGLLQKLGSQGAEVAFAEV
jgi:hypothetical protein